MIDSRSNKSQNYHYIHITVLYYLKNDIILFYFEFLRIVYYKALIFINIALFNCILCMLRYKHVLL